MLSLIYPDWEVKIYKGVFSYFCQPLYTVGKKIRWLPYNCGKKPLKKKGQEGAPCGWLELRPTLRQDYLKFVKKILT